MPLQGLVKPVVLIVDDEWIVCVGLADAVREAGHEAICATDDVHAYEILQDLGRDVCAILVDVDLGRGTTGFDVARFARKQNPDMAVIYVSGGPSDWGIAFGVEGSSFLTKPFTAEALLRELHDLVPGLAAPKPEMPRPA